MLVAKDMTQQPKGGGGVDGTLVKRDWIASESDNSSCLWDLKPKRFIGHGTNTKACFSLIRRSILGFFVCCCCLFPKKKRATHRRFLAHFHSSYNYTTMLLYKDYFVAAHN